MATTETTTTIPIGYTEDDKLGVLGTTAAPTLRDGTQLRAALLDEFRAATKAARDASRTVDADASVAVHEFRKALRRTRAVVSMISSELPKSERRAVRDALRESRRGLSTSRDHAVAPLTLATLALGEADRETANKILANAAEAVPPIAEIEDLLKNGAGRTAAQLEALEATLPAELDWKAIVGGICDIYDDARRNRRAAKKSKTAFHTWRRRSKELVYQLDFVARHAGARVQQIHAELEGVTETASSAVDLIMLREFVETYAQGVAHDAVVSLVSAIDAQLGDLRKAARKAGREAFGARANKFGKRLGKAVKKDLAPPEAPPEAS